MGKTVKVGQAIYELAISESTGKLYVASAGGEPPHVAVLDSETLDIETTIPLPDAAPYGLGINDLKVIEVRNLLRAIQHGESFQPDFEEGLRVQEVMEAIERSSAERAWVELA